MKRGMKKKDEFRKRGREEEKRKKDNKGVWAQYLRQPRPPSLS